MINITELSGDEPILVIHTLTIVKSHSVVPQKDKASTNGYITHTIQSSETGISDNS